MLPYQSSFPRNLKNGRPKALFNQYRNDYHAIDRAMQLLKLIEQFEVESSNGSGNMVKDYVDKWSAIDMCYRQFYTAYDAIVANENFHNLRDMVENLYTNGYLAKLSVLWAERLNAIGDYGKLDGVKQKEFYQQFVDPSIQKEQRPLSFPMLSVMKQQRNYTQSLKEKSILIRNYLI